LNLIKNKSYEIGQTFGSFEKKAAGDTPKGCMLMGDLVPAEKNGRGRDRVY
jgi:hypothetical protein